MLLVRRCQGIGRVLAAGLADCPGTGASLPLLQPHASTNEAWLGCSLQPSTSQAAGAAVARRLYSQMPDAERILHDTTLDAHHAAAATEEGYAAEESQEDYNAGQEVEEERHKLLEASLHHVVQLGWSAAALAAGSADLGLSPSSAGILPRGEAELVEYFMARCNHELEGQLKSMEVEVAPMGTTDRVRTGVKLRLEMNIPYINTWAQALSLQAQPASVARALQQRAEIADTIWHAAGDKSTDFNWYTKRTLLLGVYSATELYMLTDTSPSFVDTWAALDRRMDDVLQLGKAVRGVASLVEEAGSVITQLAGGLVPGRDK